MVTVESIMNGRLFSGLVSLLLSFGTAAEEVAEVSKERKQELIYLLKQDCGSCHGMTLKGGLGPNLLPETMKTRPDDYLYNVIANGIPGTAMPPWKSILKEAEIRYLVAYLKNPTDKIALIQQGQVYAH